MSDSQRSMVTEVSSGWPSRAFNRCESRVLARPEQDRAFLARQLIASLDETVESDAQAQWNEVIDRRSREMAESRMDSRSEHETIRDIRTKLHARHPAS